jgi:hypothetical protein
MWTENGLESTKRLFPKILLEDKNFSATRPCGSKGTGRCDATMKRRLSSSGCESRPAKGEPARAGRSPCDGVSNAIGDAEAGERAGRGNAAPNPLGFPDAERAGIRAGNNGPMRELGEEGAVSGGVCDHSTHEEDGPVTWEALASPRCNSGRAESR